MGIEAGTETSQQPLERAELKLPSTLESVDKIEALAEAFATRGGWDEDTACNIAMVTREAAINAVKHGNRFDEGKQVLARLERTEDVLSIRIADEGESFDPETIPDPLAENNLLRPSGRGVFLMRAFMDEVHFRQLEHGTEVALVKRRDAEAGT